MSLGVELDEEERKVCEPLVPRQPDSYEYGVHTLLLLKGLGRDHSVQRVVETLQEGTEQGAREKIELELAFQRLGWCLLGLGPVV